MRMSECQDHCCQSSDSGVRQTLDELEWERGIWCAAADGDIVRVRELTERRGGAIVHARDGAGYTALHYAARAGHLHVCSFLLARGADVNATTRSGLATPLHRAASLGNYEMAKFLISNNADVKLKDADGKTALHRAAQAQHEPIIRELLQVCQELKLHKDNKENLPLDYVHQDHLKSLFA